MNDKMMDKKEWGGRLLKAISIFIGASLLTAFSGTSAAPADRGDATPIVTGTVTYLQPTAFMSCEDE